MKITKEQKVLLFKNGLSVWIDSDKCEKIEDYLLTTKDSFFSIPDLGINLQSVYNIEGIYTPEQYDHIQHTKNGEWQCKHNRGTDRWHARFEKTDCENVCREISEKERERAKYKTVQTILEDGSVRIEKVSKLNKKLDN